MEVDCGQLQSAASSAIMRALITYERYTELLSKHINHTISPVETEDIKNFEATQPQFCPKCGAPVWSPFQPLRVAHDLEKCSVKPIVIPAKV
jgi:hypothetical protein